MSYESDFKPVFNFHDILTLTKKQVIFAQSRRMFLQNSVCWTSIDKKLNIAAVYKSIIFYVFRDL